jgi:hypothetical protein
MGGVTELGGCRFCRCVSALLLLPETRGLLNIDVRGQKVQLEEGLADFTKTDCARPPSWHWVLLIDI